MTPAEEIPGIGSSPEGTVIELRAVPRASRTELQLGEDGLRLRISAPPVEGAANAEIVKFISKVLSVPKSAVEIVGGQKGRRKRILIRGMTAKEAASILGKAAK